jgi:putative PIN family toxin of toxin-antitoxin system
VIVVVDTNVWISGILNKNGVPRRALEQALDVHLIAICHEMEAEIVDVFERKFGISPAETLVHLRLYLARAVYVEIDGTEQGCRDAEDDMILECAKKGKANLIVTGDRDLLEMGA